MAYQWFEILKKEQNAAIVAYVIMPNHLHVIIHFQNEQFNLNTIIANGKRFMAYEIVKRLKDSGNSVLLTHLENLVSEREKQKGQSHKVFKDSFDAKPIITQKFLLQKINYIYNNPVSGKWMLAKDFIEYIHSSASYYELQLIRHYTPNALPGLINLKRETMKFLVPSTSGFRKGSI